MTAKLSAREQILTTAANLFFQQGYHAVGIDTIIAAAGIAKATLYRHFPSKDALIVAYLDDVNAQFWQWFDAAAAPYPDDAKAQLIAVFAALQTLVTTPTCYGCPFIMAAGEFPESTHPAHQVALQHKQALRARLRQMAAAAHLHNTIQVADHLFLLMDGAFMAARMFGIDNPAAQVATQAAQLIRCYQ